MFFILILITCSSIYWLLRSLKCLYRFYEEQISVIFNVFNPWPFYCDIVFPKNEIILHLPSSQPRTIKHHNHSNIELLLLEIGKIYGCIITEGQLSTRMFYFQNCSSRKLAFGDTPFLPKLYVSCNKWISQKYTYKTTKAHHEILNMLWVNIVM